jgi:hypothetical protein
VKGRIDYAVLEDAETLSSSDNNKCIIVDPQRFLGFAGVE